MSRHSTRTSYQGQPVIVVAGYDRPLRELFLHVIRETQGVSGEAAEQFLYDSLDEPQSDWTDINTLVETLGRLCIAIPDSMVMEIYLDQCFNVGNRVVQHGPAG